MHSVCIIISNYNYNVHQLCLLEAAQLHRLCILKWQQLYTIILAFMGRMISILPDIKLIANSASH